MDGGDFFQLKGRVNTLIKEIYLAKTMQIYSHRLFFTQGAQFPGREHPNRLEDCTSFLRDAECVFTSGDEDDPSFLDKISSLHEYLEDLHFSEKRGFAPIDEEEETFIDRLSYKTAIAAAMTSIYAAEARGFALVRPPGHHAHRSFTHGYCLLNNMALATKQLLENGERVLVLDLDVHHGCGTEELLENERDAFMISLYQKKIWPEDTHYTYADNCLHLPLEGRVRDREYLEAFQSRVVPAIETFKPSIIGVSLGLDTFDDEQFAWELSTQSILEIRKALQKYQMFGVLEGGYEAENVSKGIKAFVEEP